MKDWRNSKQGIYVARMANEIISYQIAKWYKKKSSTKSDTIKSVYEVENNIQIDDQDLYGEIKATHTHTKYIYVRLYI